MTAPRPRDPAWTVAILATLTMTVSYVDRGTLAVLAPAVTQDLDISEAAYGWLAAAFSMAYLVGTPAAGWWIDRLGARRGLAWSLLAWSLVAAAHAVVPGFASLFVLRLALGITEGPSFPGATQTVQRIVPAAQRARGFGLLFTGSSVGALLAPPLASWMFRLAGWRVAFLVTSAIGLAWIPIWMIATRGAGVRAALDHAADRVDDAAAPTWQQLARHPLMVRGLIGVFATAPLIGYFTLWGAKYLVATFKVDQGDVGGYLWMPPLLFDAGALLFGDLAARLPRRPGAPPRALYAIGAVLGTAMALLPLAHTPWQAMAIAAVSVCGSGALYTLNTADLLSRMPPAVVATAGGILAGAQSLALILMNPIIGRVIAATAGDYDGVSIAVGLWVVPGALVWLAWRPAARYQAITR